MADFTLEIVESPALEVIVELAGVGSFVAGASTWDELSGKPSAFAPELHGPSHEPGGTDPMAVDAADDTGSLRTLGTASTSAAAGNDSRLSDTRVPTDGSVTNAKVNAAAAIGESKLNLASDAAAGTPSRRTLGTGTTQAAAGNDSRLSDSRSPTSHATSHQPGGSDAMAVDASAATGSLRTLGTSATSAAAGNDSRLSDTRVPTDGSVTDAKVSASAAIGETKLSLASDAAASTASRRTLGTGATQAAAGNHTHGASFYRTLVTLGSDVTNSATTFASATGLEFTATSGVLYRFQVMLRYEVNGATVGSRFAITGPATPTWSSYTVVSPTSNNTIGGGGSSTYDSTATTINSGATVFNAAMLFGFIQTSSTGTVTVRFAPETATLMTVYSGSTLEYW